MVPIETRLERLLTRMERNGIRQAFITKSENLYYLTGLSIDFRDRLGGLILKENGQHQFFVNDLFASAFANSEFEAVYWADGEDPLKRLAGLLDQNQAIAVEEEGPAAALMYLMKTNATVVFENIDPLLHELRMIKDPQEIAVLKKSASVSDAVIYEWFQLPFASFTEQYGSFAARELFALHDVYDLPFDPVVSFGAGSGDPMHRPRDQSFSEDLILLNVGCRTHHYCSSVSRMYFYSRPSDVIDHLYRIVYEAQQKMIDMVKPGLPLSFVNQAGLQVITEAGYRDHILHRFGQGVGLTHSEPPFITAGNHQIIQPGMVFTIEPAFYLPGQFGIKLGDMVVVTDSGCEVVSQSPKNFSSITF